MLRTRQGPLALAATLLFAASLASATAAAARTLPPPNAQFDYQIGGPYTPVASVAIVDRDRTDAPAAGKYNICYVNAFQTQPEDAAWWAAAHNDLLLRRGGATVVDESWSEILIDISTPAKRAAVAQVVDGWIDGCKRAGFQAVEPDNLDSWTRSQGLLTSTEAIAYARLLVARAHADGLAIAQKNTSELGATGNRSIGFDFAIAEECAAYGECDAYTSVYGRQVYDVEYADNGGLANFERACQEYGARISIVYRDRDVVPAGQRGYVYRWC
jgi:Glycoside-hydrolase family GH114